MKTINKIITKVNCQYGTPMGRKNKGNYPGVITSGPNCKVFKKNQKKVFDSRVRLDSGGYDKSGIYWGRGAELRVRYTKDLTFIQFYRTDNKPF